ncbi:26S proteasome non-ATPase regulatory subunit 4 homolog [Rutidosis leptorrhynchoides]|uniref:26S proteasome non-ATPase regulatory subunit 4 homolog n=1 Tax=Rutidosis leptorrhynchoides TaxID=125765 RepID=UPI003A99AD37
MQKEADSVSIPINRLGFRILNLNGSMVAEETIMICIDTSQWTSSCLNRYSYELQFKCIQSYCRAKLESSNPTYAVAIATMGTLHREWVNDTSDLDKVLRHLELNVIVDGKFNFIGALTSSMMKLRFYIPSERKRMLFFIGGPTNLDVVKAKAYGETLKRRGVALDVVNFCLLEKKDAGYTC